MTAPAVTVAFSVQAGVRTLLTAWAGLSGVDIATGPRRRDVAESLTIATPRAVSTYLGAYRSEQGTFVLVADVFTVGTGEATIDTARARALAIITEAIAALSLTAQTGGDLTIGGLVLAVGTEVTFEEAGNYIEDPAANLAGHGYTISATVSYTARLVTGG